MSPYSSKQQAALAQAAPAARASMRKLFQEQKTSSQKPKARARPTASAQQARPRPPPRTTQPLLNYMDPMCKVPMPASLSDGKALAHTSLISKDFKLPKYESTGTPATFPGPSVLLVTNTGGSAMVGLLVETRENDSGDFRIREDGVKQKLFTIPTLGGADATGHPTAGRAMKFSLSVINNTNALKRGGRVTYLNTFQRLPDIVTGGSAAEPAYYWDAVIEAIKSAPDRRRINGDNLVHPTQCIGTVVDNVRYHEFNRWRATESKAEFLNHVLDRPIDNVGDSKRPMSTVAFVFDPTDEPQDYSITVRAAFYTRWPLTSVPGQSMSPIPTATPALINAVHEHNSNKAGELTTLAAAGAAAGATGGPRMAAAGGRGADIVRRYMHGARDGLGNLLAQGEADLAAAEAAAAEMAPLVAAAL